MVADEWGKLPGHMRCRGVSCGQIGYRDNDSRRDECLADESQGAGDTVFMAMLMFAQAMVVNTGARYRQQHAGCHKVKKDLSLKELFHEYDTPEVDFFATFQRITTNKVIIFAMQHPSP